MTRLLVLALIVLAAYRLLVGRWPWEKRRSAGERRTLRARGTLGVAAGASRTEILAAHRRLVAANHPDRGGSAARVHEANEARDVLLADLPDRSIAEPKEPT